VPGDDDYLSKSPSAGRMGKAAEYLVASFCILATRGALNVSTSLIDDEGVDLVFHRLGGTATLAVQVKARMSDSKRIQAGSFMSFVRAQTFAPRADLDMLFIAVDIQSGSLMQAWLVPSLRFAELAGKPTSQGRYRFYASMGLKARDRWVDFRLTAAELPPRVLARLESLEK
jgi:hypothetical protein